MNDVDTSREAVERLEARLMRAARRTANAGKSAMEHRDTASAWFCEREAADLKDASGKLLALRAALDAAEAERDALRAQCVAMLGEGAATAREHVVALATARREAAEAMREKAAEAVRVHIQETDPAPALTCDLMDCIRALPLPGDEA